jgi:uncharacterized membrane protein
MLSKVVLFALLLVCLLVAIVTTELVSAMADEPWNYIAGFAVGALLWLLAYGPVERRFGR